MPQAHHEAKGDALSKVDVYVADYVTIDDVTKEESDRLASNECMVGSSLIIRATDEAGSFEVVSSAGNSIGRIRPKNKLAFRDALENGWTMHCWLSLVYYVESEKRFHGEVVYQFHKVKQSQTDAEAALNAFEEGISQMLADGKRPRVKVTGNEYDQIISSGGSWRPDETEALPFATKRGSGIVVFKRKRSVSDKLALAALERNPGCRIALVAVLLVIVVAVALVVLQCTRG